MIYENAQNTQKRDFMTILRRFLEERQVLRSKGNKNNNQFHAGANI